MYVYPAAGSVLQHYLVPGMCVVQLYTIYVSFRISLDPFFFAVVAIKETVVQLAQAPGVCYYLCWVSSQMGMVDVIVTELIDSFDSFYYLSGRL